MTGVQTCALPISLNVAVGDYALNSNNANNNTAVGYQAGYSNTTGGPNTTLGSYAGYGITTGTNNTAVGYGSLGYFASAYTTGAYNVALGDSALGKITSASNNTAVGYQAGYANTTGGIDAFGCKALESNTTGTGNVGIGQGVLATNTTGNSNTAVGYQALEYNSTASYNTAVGYQALYSNTTANSSTAVGWGSLYNATGTANTAIGVNSGNGLTTGTVNTFLGASAGYAMTTGSNNTIIGSYTGNQGGLDIRTASNYIVLSDGSGNPRVTVDGSGNVMFGATAFNASVNSNFFLFGSGNGTEYIGHVSGTSSGVAYQDFRYNGTNIGSITQNGTTAVLYNTTSDYRLKSNPTKITNGLDTISKLNPVNFTWNTDNTQDSGFIAHEFQSVLPRSVTGEKDAVDKDGKPVYQAMDNSGAIPFLVAAIQEQQALITDLQTKLKAAGIAGF